MLRPYGIDFEERPTTEPFVSLHWNGIIYTDVSGITDSLMFAGRLPIEGSAQARREATASFRGSPDIAAIGLAGVWELPPSITQRITSDRARWQDYATARSRDGTYRKRAEPRASSGSPRSILRLGVEFTTVWTKRRGSGFVPDKMARPVTG